TIRVSVDSDGNQANGDSQYPAISQDGQYVAFESNASNLVLGDTNGNWDIFAYDFQSTPDDPGGVGNLPGGSGGGGGCFINTIANER
ncbi:MAG: PD40 domain-containing protein, partial [Deltaproteobacteria bacterium]|nr:PD40 domain-containing protein [Deltaproteobacteria bacterium]